MDTRNTAAANRSLAEALDESVPANDPAALTQPAGEVREASGCCGGVAETEKAPSSTLGSDCCGCSTS